MHPQAAKSGNCSRSKLLRLINAMGRSLLGNGVSWLSLDEKILLDKACKRVGLDDFGDDSFRQPLRILLNCYETEAELNFIGRICVQNDILRLLGNRLHLVEDRKRFPDIAAEIIPRPLFITGLPRSGTTFLHALLAQDPAHRAPQVWEVMYPSPPPEKISYDSDRRIVQMQLQLKSIDFLMPDLRAVHLIDARLPQECIAITSHDFRSHVFETMYFMPSYRTWYDGQDKRPAYEFHRRFLQHLQWRCPGKRWVLKAPSHLLALKDLFQVYPEAEIVLTHRDPLTVLPSCASFTEVLRSAFTDHIDKRALGLEVMSRWEEGARLAIECRQGKNGLPGTRFFDVHYAELVRSPLSVVKGLYRHFDLELTDRAETAMRRFVAANPKDKGGMHRYSLEEFGLNPEVEKRRFQFYMDHWGIEPET
ncbi:MAG: sulfotransferase [Desulfobaccales bacterium]